MLSNFINLVGDKLVEILVKLIKLVNKIVILLKLFVIVFFFCFNF